jgi:arylsulfatase A-like enzyme
MRKLLTLRFAGMMMALAYLLFTEGGTTRPLVTTVAAQRAKPNLIVILADDLGYSDLSCYGGEIQTPNLDGLAKNGLRFTQFYNSARCCPTRAALLTGLYPHEAGIGMMTGDAGANYPGYRGVLQPYTVTLAEVLKGAGYRTAMSGKWHVLILFLSDNGACAEWEPFGFDLKPPANVTAGTGINMGTPNMPNLLHQGAALSALGGADTLFSYGSAWANLSNTPWRLYKHYSHEGGISSPLIVHWPAQIKARGQWRNQPGHIIDVMATLVDVAGATYPKERAGVATLPMEGVSLRPAFSNKPLARNAPLFFEHDGSRAVREGDWKLVSTRGGEWELYNIAADRVELNNLAAKHPDKVNAMAARWDEWANRTNVLPRPGN